MVRARRRISSEFFSKRTAANVNAARLKLGKAAEHFRYERTGILIAVGLGSLNYDGKRQPGCLLLIGKVLVHRHKKIEC